MTEVDVQRTIRLGKRFKNKKRSGRASVSSNIRKERIRLEAKRDNAANQLEVLQNQICKHPNLKLDFNAVEKMYEGKCHDCHKPFKTAEEPKDEDQGN